MSGLQNLNDKTKNTSVDFNPIPYSELSLSQQMWVDYCAIQGLITNEDGSVTKMTIAEIAKQCGVSHQTLYDWKKLIPNFNDLVAERCAELWNGPRTVKVVNAIYLSATVKLNVQAQALWMANQKAIDFRMPQQEVKHEVGDSWGALLQNKRRVIEGEVVDADKPKQDQS